MKARTQTFNGPLVVIQPAAAGLPTESWWTKARTRQEFDRLAAQAYPRMMVSTFGRSNGLLLGANSRGAAKEG